MENHLNKHKMGKYISLFKFNNLANRLYVRICTNSLAEKKF